MDDIKTILNSYNYKISFTSCYTKKIYDTNNTKEKNLSLKKYFTLLDNEGRVVGRIHSFVKDNPNNNNKVLQILISYFRTFNLPYGKEIIKKLDKILMKKS